LNLNIQTEQAVRLVDMAQWDACNAAVNPDDLRDRPCFGGLDLSTVNDLAAFVLCFPPDESDGEYTFLAWHWCPEETARKRERIGRVPYVTWARESLIELTPRRDIDYRWIRSRINALGETYSIQSIGYDPWNATHLSKELSEDDGFEMVEYRQGYVSMNEPTKGLLRLMLSRQIRHGGNKCLRWQASNLASKPDPAGNLKPDKEASADKIDGMVALIMSLGMALRTPIVTSAYASGGVFYPGDEDYAG
jgi:phage terminase large subunit-like protein